MLYSRQNNSSEMFVNGKKKKFEKKVSSEYESPLHDLETKTKSY